MYDTKPVKNFGMLRVASVTPRVEISNPAKNTDYILEAISSPEVIDSDVIVLPELCLTGYTCGDLFFQKLLLDEASRHLRILAEKLKGDKRLMATGVPLVYNGRLYNCAAIIANGEILGVVPKTYIPNYQEFYEKRWFSSGKEIENKAIDIDGVRCPFGTNLLFEHCGGVIGVEICEDLWVPIPPSSKLCTAGADIILNLSATDDNIGKYGYIKNLTASQSARCRCVYAYSSAGQGESSSDLVFSGINIIAYDGKILAESERFSRESNAVSAMVDIEKLRLDRRKYSTFYDCEPHDFISQIIKSGTRPAESAERIREKINPLPFIPSEEFKRNESCKEIINIQTWGLAQRLEVTGCSNLVVGISGGLDSTLALLIAHNTFKQLEINPTGIIGVTMPSDATSERTYRNARALIENLGMTFMEISIKKAVEQHFEDIGHDALTYDTVYENSQARERTQILMDLANKYSGMVLGTGDMSELALGWCTYNGDHMSMYNVNAGVPKTLVKHLVDWFADNTSDLTLKSVLKDIIATPISPELIPAQNDEQIGQKTEELVGPYELHDFFLFHTLRNGFSPDKVLHIAILAFQDKYTREEIIKWLKTFYRRFFTQQFKRSCMPDGPKIGSVCLSPRGDWRMPSDASSQIWIEDILCIHKH